MPKGIYLFLTIAIALQFAVTVNTTNADQVWINEFHYDNDGGDVGEFIEIVTGPNFTGALSDVTLTLYNGNGGGAYGSSHDLSTFQVGDTVNGFNVYSKLISGIQNGSPDGFTIDVNGTVTQFLSYEGTFTATDGVANGLTSTDIGVSEGSSTAAGFSL